MPFILRRLDTRFPPTWDGNASGIPVFVDDETWLRHINGEDKVNYRTSQRPEGDLFKRDLVGEQNVAAVRDYLATRSGLCFDIPEVRLLPGEELQICRISPPAPTPNWIFVGWGLTNETDSAESFSLSLTKDGEVDPLYVKTANTVEFKAATLTTAPILLPSASTYRCKLRNIGASRKVASAFIIMQPQTY